MQDLLIGAAILVALIVLDVCAQRFGVDTRYGADMREPPNVWWF